MSLWLSVVRMILSFDNNLAPLLAGVDGNAAC